jgi:hypothetical protein
LTAHPQTIDTVVVGAGLTTLFKPCGPAELAFALDRLAMPVGGVVTNLAVILPGVFGGSFDAHSGRRTWDPIRDRRRSGALQPQRPRRRAPTHAQPSTPPHAALSVVLLAIRRGGGGQRLATVCDVLLWIEYEVA